MKRPEFAHLLAYWGGRFTELSLALDRARSGPLDPRIHRQIAEAFYAVNRAQVYLHESERELDRPKRRKAKRKA